MCSLFDPQHYQQLIHALVPCLEGHISFSKSVMADPEGGGGGGGGGGESQLAICFHRNTGPAL